VKPIPVVFHIWKLQIHTYGIGLAITFWFAFRYFERRLRSRGYPYEWLTGVFVWVVVAAVIGARVLHVVSNWGDYSSDPIQVFAIWNGGLSSWGGLLFAVPTGMVLARRRCPSLRAVDAADLVAPVLMAAWGVGRLLGPQLMVAGGGHPTHQWFGMYYAGQVGKRLPVPIFQSIESFVIFGILLLIERHLTTRPRGFVTAAAMTLWGLERFVEEKLWLSYPGHLGAELVEGAGLALCATGLVVAAVLWRHRDSLPVGIGPVRPSVDDEDADRGNPGHAAGVSGTTGAPAPTAMAVAGTAGAGTTVVAGDGPAGPMGGPPT
jgi:phosphatidylglycerol:prolipoprotein diacylglycerol transferase